MPWAKHLQQNVGRSVRKGPSARSRQRMLLMFVCLAAGLTLLLLFLVAPSGSTTVLVLDVVSAVVVAAAVALGVERWNRSRIVDLRHNDLAEGFRYGLIPRATGLTDGAVRNDVRTRTTGSPLALEHRLFGACDCAECASGMRPATVDLRHVEAPSPGTNPDDGRRTSPF